MIFIRSFESFEIPALVGLPGDIRVLTTSIYLDAQKLPPQYGSAGAFSVLLMFVVAATLYLYFRMTREGDRFHTVTGKGYRPAVIHLGRWRYLAGCGLFFYSRRVAGAAFFDHSLGFALALLHAAVVRSDRQIHL